MLTVDTEGCPSVRLFGVLDRSRNTDASRLVSARPPYAGATNIGRVVGILEDGLATLDDCIRTRNQYSFTGAVSSSTLDAKRAYLTTSRSLDSGETLVFSSVSVGIEGLFEWLSMPPWQNDSGLNHDTDGLVISSTGIEPLEAQLRDGTQLLLSSYGTAPTRLPTDADITLSQDAQLHIRPPEPCGLDTYTEIAQRFQNLLSLAVDRPLSITSLVGYSPQILSSALEPRALPVDIFGRFPNPPKVGEFVNSNSMLFQRPAIADSLEAKLNAWWSMYDDARGPLSLYFAVTHDAYGNIEGELLALAQAAEGLHRFLMRSKSRVSDEELDQVVDEIRSQLDEEQWKIVEGRLTYPNEPAFAVRLGDLLEPLKGHLGNSKQRSSFVFKVSAMRNVLTHQKEPDERVDMSPESLIVVTRKLRAVVQTKLLDLLGFSGEEIDSMVEHRIKEKLDVSLL